MIALQVEICMVLDLTNSGIIYELGLSLTRSWKLILDHMISHQFIATHPLSVNVALLFPVINKGYLKYCI